MKHSGLGFGTALFVSLMVPQAGNANPQILQPTVLQVSLNCAFLPACRSTTAFPKCIRIVNSSTQTFALGTILHYAVKLTNGSTLESSTPLAKSLPPNGDVSFNVDHDANPNVACHAWVVRKLIKASP